MWFFLWHIGAFSFWWPSLAPLQGDIARQVMHHLAGGLLFRSRLRFASAALWQGRRFQHFYHSCRVFCLPFCRNCASRGQHSSHDPVELADRSSHVIGG